MDELLRLLSIYYECSALAEAGLLPQAERFACNDVYQAAKRLFLGDGVAGSGTALTSEQNTQAYLLFKAWEVENIELVSRLKGQ